MVESLFDASGVRKNKHKKISEFPVLKLNTPKKNCFILGNDKPQKCITQLDRKMCENGNL